MTLFMRVLCGAAWVLAAAAVRAEVKVSDDVWNGSARFSGVDYGVSERFHRAWLVLHFVDDGPCRDSDGRCELDEPVRVMVPGLTYDPAARQVLYADGAGVPVVCATLVRHTFVWSWDTVEPTGKCGPRTVRVDRFVDDGFEGHRDARQEILFGASRR